jgi:release factor glutamine methyltransferase
MTGNEALRAAIPQLQAAGVETAIQDARALLAFALQIPPGRLTLALPDPVPNAAQARFAAAIAARVQRQPVSQITGQRLFWGRSFKVTQDTLDPRPETEILVAEALKSPFRTILDLGTGTGCILLSCLAERPTATGVGVDISADALVVARENAAMLGLGARAQFLRSDWFSDVSGQFDLIVANPPYIAQCEMNALSPEVGNWEPHLALSPGGDGLDAYRAIAKGACGRLTAGGRLIVEIGPTQAEAVSALFLAEGLQTVEVLQDLDGRDRVVVATAAKLSES